MIYIDMSVEVFSKKYDIRTDPIICGNCDAQMAFTKPFRIKGYAGIIAECKCGNELSRSTPCDTETQERWRSLLGY